MFGRVSLFEQIALDPRSFFTNNGNVKLTARPAIDTSAGRGLVLFTRGKLPRRLFFRHVVPRLILVVLLLITLFLICFLSFYISLSSFFLHSILRCAWSSMHLHHRFIVADVRIIFRQEIQAKQRRQARHK